MVHVNLKMILSIICTLVFSTLAAAQERLPGVFTYQGRAFQPDGVTPLTGSATFSVQVRSANGNCLLYEESHVGVDLTTSAGFFALNIGDGTASSGLAMTDSFSNLSIAKTTLSGTCGGAYTPLNQDSRVLRITVDVGGGPIALDDQYVYTAPQALVADTLSGFKYDQFVQSLSTAQRDALTSMVNGTTIYNITTGRFNRYNGASWIEAFGATNVGTGSQIYSSKMAGNDWLQLRSIIGSNGVTATQNANDITLEIDSTYAQRRVTGSCAAGNFITAVAADGTVTCAADSSGSGTVTSVTAGDAAITVAGTAADPTVALTTCADDQILKMNGAAWNCEADAEGLTSINVGATLAGDGVSTALNVAANAIDHDGVLAGAELLAACGAGEILKYEGIVNGWECATETTVSVVTANTVPVSNGTDYVNSPITLSTANVGIATAVATARLHLPAGTAAAGTAPLKLTSGIDLGTPEEGAIEFDGTNLYFTDSVPTRRTIATSTTLGSYVLKAGDTMTGPLVNNSNSASTALAVTQSGAGHAATFMGGNVGVGTTTPTVALQVDGTSLAIRASNVSESKYIELTGGGAGGSAVQQTFEATSSWAVPGITAYKRNGTNYWYSGMPGSVTLGDSYFIGPNNDASGANFFIEKSSGNVGIGTTSPSTKLQVAGAVSVSAGSLSAGNPVFSYLPINTSAGAGFTTNAAGRTTVLSNFFDGDSLALITGTAGGANGIQIGGASSTLGQNIQFLTANGERMRISSTGNVGIGTTGPTATLHLKAGTAAVGTAPLKLTSGTNLTAAEEGAIEFDGTNLYVTNSALTRKTIATTDKLGNYVLKAGDTMTGPLVNNSNDALTALSVTQSGAGYAGTFMGGNVGIGTVTPGYSLQVLGNSDYAADFAGNNAGWLTVRRPGDTAGTGLRMGISSSNEGQIGTTAARTLSLITNNTQRLSILSTGNVGIGTTTPSFNLSFPGNSNQSIGMERPAAGDGYDLTLSASGAASGTTNRPGGDLYLSSGMPTGNNASNIYFQVADGSVSGSGDVTPTTKMRITGSGKVGINTPAAPLAMLDVVGTSGVTARLDSAASWLQFNETDTTKVWNMIVDGSNLSIREDGTVNTRFVIKPGGNIGIGGTSASAKLHLPAGTTAVGTAPLKFDPTAAALTTTPENGTMEYDGTDFWLSNGTTAGNRKKILTSAGGVGDFVLKAGDTMTGPLVNNSNSASTALAVTQSGAGNAGTFMGGKVGIGTTAPATSLSFGNASNAVASDGTNTTWVDGLNIATSTNMPDNTYLASIATLAGDRSHGLLIKAGKAGDPQSVLRLQDSSGGEMMTVQANGRVGLSNNSPAATLSVGTGSNALLSDGTSTVSNLGVNVSLSSITNGQYAAGITSGNNRGGGLLIKAGHTDGTGYPLRIQNSFGTEVLAVRGTGRVGITTVSPSSELSVGSVGDTLAGDGTHNQGAQGLNVHLNHALSTFTASFINDGGNNQGILIKSTSKQLHAMDNSGNSRFIVANDKTGINQIAPASALSIGVSSNALMNDGGGRSVASTGAQVRISNGGTYVMGLENGNSNSSGLYVRAGDTGNYQMRLQNYDGTKEYMSVRGSGVGIGTATPAYPLDVNGAVQATAYYYTSDARKKENITTLENSLDKILHLRGVNFNWISDGKPEVGLIAQEVESVYPDLVATDAAGWKAVKYGNLVAPLIESTKELYGMCKMQEEQMARIEAKLQSHDRSIASLKIENDKLKKENTAIKAYLCEKDPTASICK